MQLIYLYLLSISNALTLSGLTYQSTIAGYSTNTICLGVTTTLNIPRAGGLVLKGPPGFVFSSLCTPKPATGSAELPYDSYCRSSVGVINSIPTVIITAGPSGISANTYTFCLSVTNPPDSTPSGVSPGTWTMHSYSVVSLGNDIEPGASISSFAISNAMISGGLVQQPRNRACFGQTPAVTCTLQELSYWTANRNDRPAANNQVILTLTLASNSVSSSSLQVRAPQGYVFPTQCAVVTDAAKVFNATNTDGIVNPLFTYTEWAPSALLGACTGNGNIARIPIAGGLLAGQSYVFRIGVVNPSTKPVYNLWTVTVASQESLPSIGFPIWLFNAVKLTPSDRSVSSLSTFTYNTLTFLFTALNSVSPGGFLTVAGPAGFQIPTSCNAGLTTGVSNVTISCAGTLQASNQATVTLTGSAALIGGNAYLLKLVVINPQTVGAAQSWTLQSYEPPLSLLDTSVISGFAVNLIVPSFEIISYNSSFGGDAVNLVFTTTFGQTLNTGDRIVLNAPIGFVLHLLGTNVCTNYRLLPINGVPGPIVLSNNQPTCAANALTLYILNGAVAANTQISFQVSSVNPAVSPVVNSFSIQHINSQDVILESRVIAGYPINPQMTQVSILPSNPIVTEAGGTSNVIISFVPVSNANFLVVSGSVAGTAPFGFNAATCNSTIAKRSPTSLNISVPLIAGTVSNVLISNVTNPAIAGVPLWRLSTYKGSSKQDERVGFPGFTILSQIQVLSTSTLSPQFYGTQGAVATFRLTCTDGIPAKGSLQITAPTGWLIVNNSLIALSGFTVGSHGLQNDQIYKVQLTSALIGSAVFQIQLNLPSLNTQQSNWTIQGVDESGNSMATNDGLFGGFPLIAGIPFSITPSALTPGATITIQISMMVPLQITASSSVNLQVSAPTGFNFNAGTSCLKYVAGFTTAFAACIGTGNTAVLTVSGNTLSAGAQVVFIIVTNPAQTPDVNNWTLTVYKNGLLANINNQQSIVGYSIQSMTVDVIGSDILGLSAPVFFSISPDLTFNATAVTITVTPATGLGYIFLCNPSYVGGLSQAPSCSGTGSPDAPVILTLPQGEWISGVDLTLGIQLTNPGVAPRAVENMFSLVAKDYYGNIVDANMDVPGLPLQVSSFRPNYLGWVGTVSEWDVSTVQIAFTVTSTISFVTSMALIVTAPIDIVFSAPSTVKTGGGLPVIDVAPYTVGGNILTVRLAPLSTLATGTYTIRFQVKNPKILPTQNVWRLTANTNDGTTYFSAAFQGYLFGESSSVTI